SAPVSAVTMSPHGEAASVDDNGHLLIWRQNGEIEATHDGWGRGDLVFSEDGRSLAGDTGSSLSIVEAGGQHTLKVLASSENFILGAAYLAGEDIHLIRLWKTGDGYEVTPVPDIRGLREIQFDPSGRFLGLEQADLSDPTHSHVVIRIWDI